MPANSVPNVSDREIAGASAAQPRCHNNEYNCAMLDDLWKLPNGSRFYRCAFQVNPFNYVKRYKQPTTFTDENSYNTALIQACIDLGIEVVAITDH